MVVPKKGVFSKRIYFTPLLTVYARPANYGTVQSIENISMPYVDCLQSLWNTTRSTVGVYLAVSESFLLLGTPYKRMKKFYLLDQRT